ncbi:MAG: site-2 protease family protein, partial [Acidobacteriia bacterium]|nr:site-2 protease family protein [Terriglobia bacterium]
MPEDPRGASSDPDGAGSDRSPDRHFGVTLRPSGGIAPLRRGPAQWIEEGLPERPPNIVQPKQRVFLSSVLFLLTVASTSYIVSPTYSVCVLAILTAHEFGHYLAARHYRVPATLPYFLPAPVLFGTMGAVIRMSPFLPNRKALFDISAAGP